MKTILACLATALVLVLSGHSHPFKLPPKSKRTLAGLEAIQERILRHDAWVERTRRVHTAHAVWWHRRQRAWTTRELASTRSALRARQRPVADFGKWFPIFACESAGLGWGVHTGNGYEGGLQIAPSNWISYGGLRFAARAYLASPAAQILIAERILRDQSWAAWPVCSARAGYR